MSDWIIVPNWSRFQHYHDRAPTWIKLYLALVSDEDWLELTDSERGVLVSIWLSYARADGQLTVGRMLTSGQQRNRRRTIKRLTDAGWIKVSSSRPLALARSRKEKEKEPPTPKRPVGSRLTGWRLVRGSHGVTHIPDPAGTDVPPTDARTR